MFSLRWPSIKCYSTQRGKGSPILSGIPSDLWPGSLRFVLWLVETVKGEGHSKNFRIAQYFSTISNKSFANDHTAEIYVKFASEWSLSQRGWTWLPLHAVVWPSACFLRWLEGWSGGVCSVRQWPPQLSSVDVVGAQPQDRAELFIRQTLSQLLSMRFWGKFQHYGRRIMEVDELFFR